MGGGGVPPREQRHMAMTDAYGNAVDYRARTGPPLAGQAADVARRHGTHLARPSAA